MFEAVRDVPDRLRYLRVDGVLLAARRGGMMGFIQDQQCSATKRAEPVPQRPHIRLVDQQTMRDQKTRVRGPGIHSESAFAADTFHVVLVEDLEGQPESILQLLLPLE